MPFARSLLVRYFILLAIGWTLIITASWRWNLSQDEDYIWETAYAEARANLNKDITFRRWATMHGGVYVPVTETQQSVPFLSHVEGRDVTTTDGRELTLLNPASMMRQIMDRHAEDYGVRGRITGLKWLNPDNAPDPWEKEQLEAFTRGEKNEIWEVAEISGRPYLRYLRAMMMEPGCEKCHAILGYKLGDMRGATGLNLPLDRYYREISESRTTLGLSHGAIWFLGIIGLVWTGQLSSERDRERAAAEMEREKNAETIRLYASVFEKSGESIVITDHDNRIVAINPAMTQHSGYTPDELIGKNPKVLASGQTPREVYEDLWQSLNSRGFWQGELIDQRKDGGSYTKWTAITAIRDVSGEVSHYLASYTDITER